jgi:hypothetical protein
LINILVTAGHDTTIRPYIETWVPERVDRFSIITYEDLAHLETIPAGSTIFGDLERLDAAQMRLAREVRDCLIDQAPGVQVLNDPDHALLRYDLLVQLHEAGEIPYRAYRLSDTTTPERFPVFIRNEHDHTGPRTRLLNDQNEVDAAILRLIVRRRPLQRLLMVEYHETGDAEGFYRKYGAFVVGDRVLSRHLNVRKHWIVKGAGMEAPEIRAEELEYVKANPHMEEITRICKLGGIEFGRIDYSMVGEAVVTWEINTNPVVVKSRESQTEISLPRQLVFVPALTEAFEAIDDHAHHGHQVTLSGISEDIRRHASRRTPGVRAGAKRAARPGKPIMEAALTGIEYAARPFRRRIIAAKIKRTAG